MYFVLWLMGYSPVLLWMPQSDCEVVFGCDEEGGTEGSHHQTEGWEEGI